MTDDEFARTCAAGIEFYTAIKAILEKYELPEGHAPSIVMMAMGAILKTSGVTPEVLVQGGQETSKMWDQDERSVLPFKAWFIGPDNGN